ncbi:uncharacterized protein Rpp21 isoform X1 [Chelonus insularis]|uniref:uncharacterized protein Rpp21 isoform X1 n=1 Tax=Chelonus insularis TaxID=460826 RepID=UPI00158BB3D2|nr:uncharacterized protein LOC118065532 isoform X1 [Chelonus insularis]
MENFFSHHKHTAQKIDNKLKKLLKIWESPHVLLNGSEKNSEETKICLKYIKSRIALVQNELNEDSKNIPKYLDDMDKFLQDCRMISENLEQGIDDIKLLYSEYGFTRPPSGLESEIHPVDDDLPQEIENFNITLQSNSIDQYEDEDEENNSSICNQSITSPGNPTNDGTHTDETLQTPARVIPQEPIFSPYYYSNY